jgi:hypothetical protein
MTFELMRAGWPNTAAILALAIMPIVALTVATERQPAVVEQPAVVQQTAPAAFCLTPAECTVIAAVAAPEFVTE